MSQILVMSNEQGTVGILSKILRTEGYKTVSTDDPSKATQLMKDQEFSLIMSGGDKDWDPEFELVRAAQAELPNVPVIVITQKDGGESTAKALELRPFACIEKPLKVHELLATVQQAIDYADAAAAGNVNLNLQLETRYQFENIVAESPAMRTVCEMLSRIAATDVTILISGEEGTGKGTLAEAIHLHSRRKDKPFVTAACDSASIDADLFGGGKKKGAAADAAGGTLFLREVQTLPAEVQATLATALDGKEVPARDGKPAIPINVRVIASVSGDLGDAVSQGSFSEELYRHLKVIPITIPPLRERREDIAPMVKQVLQRQVGHGKVLPPIAAEVLEKLEQYSWPGNIPEATKVIKHALKKAGGGELTVKCLPRSVTR